MRADDVYRRPLPNGYDNDESDFFVPKPIRSYFVTVTAPPARDRLTDFMCAIDAACDWAEHDHEGKGTFPGGGLA